MPSEISKIYQDFAEELSKIIRQISGYEQAKEFGICAGMNAEGNLTSPKDVADWQKAIKTLDDRKAGEYLYTHLTVSQMSKLLEFYTDIAKLRTAGDPTDEYDDEEEITIALGSDLDEPEEDESAKEDKEADEDSSWNDGPWYDEIYDDDLTRAVIRQADEQPICVLQSEMSFDDVKLCFLGVAGFYALMFKRDIDADTLVATLQHLGFAEPDFSIETAQHFDEWVDSDYQIYIEWAVNTIKNASDAEFEELIMESPLKNHWQEVVKYLFMRSPRDKQAQVRYNM